MQQLQDDQPYRGRCNAPHVCLPPLGMGTSAQCHWVDTERILQKQKSEHMNDEVKINVNIHLSSLLSLTKTAHYFRPDSSVHHNPQD